MIGPGRAKIGVQVLNFPFQLPAGPGHRRRVAFRVAHAGAAPVVHAGVTADVAENLGVNMSFLDGLGNLPGLPSFGDFELPSFSLPSFPNPFDGGDDDGDDTPENETDDGGIFDSIAGFFSNRLAQPSNVSIEVRSTEPGLNPSAIWAAGAAEAVAANPELVDQATANYGGDVVAMLLENGALPELPGEAFRFRAYSTWVDRVFIDETENWRRVHATALGQASAHIGALAGIGAAFFAGVNASASVHYVAFDTDASWMYWDPEIGVGERVAWRAARSVTTPGGSTPSAASGASEEGGAPATAEAPEPDSSPQDQTVPGWGARAILFGSIVVVTVIVVALLVKVGLVLRSRRAEGRPARSPPKGEGVQFTRASAA